MRCANTTKKLKNTIVIPDSVPVRDNSSLLPDKNGVYREPEKLPSFPGGAKALGKYLAKYLKWPEPELDVQGKVFIAFIVERNGKLSHVTVLKGLQSEVDAEALQLVKQMPKWIPGKVEHKRVRCYFTLPINFSIED